MQKRLLKQRACMVVLFLLSLCLCFGLLQGVNVPMPNLDLGLSPTSYSLPQPLDRVLPTQPQLIYLSLYASSAVQNLSRAILYAVLFLALPDVGMSWELRALSKHNFMLDGLLVCAQPLLAAHTGGHAPPLR